MLLVEQGLRLASLVHDLGHLPFSHDFELALEDHLRTSRDEAERYQHLLGEAVHERVGYQLADVVQVHVFNRALADQPELAQLLPREAVLELLMERDELDRVERELVQGIGAQIERLHLPLVGLEPMRRARAGSSALGVPRSSA